MAATSCVLVLALAIAPLAALGQQAVFDEFERLERVDQACIGGPPGRPNEFDIVRRDCCSIPRARLAGDIEGIDPCPLNEADIIGGSSSSSGYRNSFVRARVNAQSGSSSFSFLPDDPDDGSFRVSNTRIFDDENGNICFCPIVMCPADRPSYPPSAPHTPSFTVTTTPSTSGKQGSG
ncbi:unnamed protein product [Ostreobium quekettii]|uniref:Uncharacterized protein n=1 Tax=Ostreobium quekettii TaxID=121088 RepID=A0A8S1JCT8_9CHLO|nr:unnamed protein product [Ostreobium quekettii]|eukprot:evm.model.scf_1117.2 EVM.evm.TU.scf_1117.2   scf_1117:36654-38602(-)